MSVDERNGRTWRDSSDGTDVSNGNVVRTAFL